MQKKHLVTAIGVFIIVCGLLAGLKISQWLPDWIGLILFVLSILVALLVERLIGNAR